MRREPLISRRTRFLTLREGLTLESGARLAPVTVAYRTWGRLARDGGNCVLVCHALTGSADVDRWWPGLLGPGRALDPERDLVVCANVPGSCYGSTGPLSPCPATGRPWGPDLPELTVRDIVRLHAKLLRYLGVRSVELVIGGSLGGMTALEWAATAPLPVSSAVVVAAPAAQPPWAIALSEAQRAAIHADAVWAGGRYLADAPPRAGLAAARMMAMCSYRAPAGMELRFGREVRDDGRFQCVSWLEHHGRALVERFDANSYLALTRTMDRHDLGAGRGGWREVAASLEIPVLVVGITSDVLYPPEEVAVLADALPHGELAWIESPHGHDAFLIDTDRLDELVRGFRGTGLARPAQLAG